MTEQNKIRKVHMVESLTSKRKVYQVIEFEDGWICCNCPSFTHRQGCKHIQKIKDEAHE